LADHYDAKVDLWSVGVILFGECRQLHHTSEYHYTLVETLFGHAPYSSQTTDELIEKIRQDVPITVWLISDVHTIVHSIADTPETTSIT